MFCFVVVCFVLILSDWILLEGEKTAGKLFSDQKGTNMVDRII